MSGNKSLEGTFSDQTIETVSEEDNENDASMIKSVSSVYIDEDAGDGNNDSVDESLNNENDNHSKETEFIEKVSPAVESDEIVDIPIPETTIAFKFFIGQIVSCGPFGNGTIIDQKNTDCSLAKRKMYSIQLNNWKLATGNNPVFFTTESFIDECENIKIEKELKEDMLRKAREKEERDRIFAEWMGKAVAFKSAAGEYFKSNSFLSAKTSYLESLNALNSLQERFTQMSTEERAKLVELNILCHNNLALCSLRLEAYPDAIASARNALILIAAIESKQMTGELWRKLNEIGVNEDKVLKDWKKKSLFYQGKAELLRRNYTASIDLLESALELVKNDENYSASVKELRGLILKAKQQRTDESKKEKSTWQNAFKKNETAPEENAELPAKDSITLKNAAVVSPSKKATSSKRSDDVVAKVSSGWSTGFYLGLGLSFGAAALLGMVLLRGKSLR